MPALEFLKYLLWFRFCEGLKPLNCARQIQQQTLVKALIASETVALQTFLPCFSALAYKTFATFFVYNLPRVKRIE